MCRHVRVNLTLDFVFPTTTGGRQREKINTERRKSPQSVRIHAHFFIAVTQGLKKHLSMDGVRDSDGQIGKRLGKKGGVKRLNWTERGETLGHMVWWEIPH